MRIVNLFFLSLFCLTFGAIFFFASVSIGDDGLISGVDVIDYDNAKVAISLVTLIGFIVMAIKLGMEIRNTRAHIEDVTVHVTQDFRNFLDKEYKKETECSITAKIFCEQLGSQKEELGQLRNAIHVELREIREQNRAMSDILSRVDERTSKIS